MGTKMGMLVPLTARGLGWIDASQLPAEGKITIELDRGHWPDPRLLVTWEEPDPIRDATREEWDRRKPQDATQPTMKGTK